MVQAVAACSPSARINGVTIQNMSSQRRGREVNIGLVTDDPFGPVITFGAGGTMIELIDDRAMELPPLNQYLAHRLIERTRVPKPWGSGAVRRRSTWRHSSRSCCGCPRWCASCRNCARWTSTR
jgi:acetyltransferase